MSQAEWFRRTTWTPDDQTEFAARLKRSRGAYYKAQYLRIQALHLAQVGTEPMLRAALTLLDQLLREYPGPTQLAGAWHLRATCLADLGEHVAAIEAFRQSFAAVRAAPNWRTSAHGEFAELVVGLGRRDIYPEVLATLDEFGRDDLFPLERFRAAVSRAIISADRNDTEAARRHAQEALAAAAATESPFRYHRRLGLVRFVDPEMMDRLRRLAA